VYVASRGSNTQLYLRPMDQLNAKPIPGTEGASMPFFSPDGQWVGFFAAGKLKKVSLMRGVPLRLCDAPNNRGASWGPDDTIRFTPVYTSGLWSISAAGGTPQVLTTPDSTKGELSHRWPEVLPGGKAVLFTVETAGSFDNASIAVLSLQSGEQRCLVEGGSNPHYASSGHLVFARAGVVLAAPFDLERLEMTGAPVAMLEGVMEDPTTGAAQFSISGVGSLVYVPGGAVAEGALVWVDREGTTDPLAANRRAFATPRLSPDGQQLAVTVNGRDIWVCQVARGTFTKFTFDPGVDERPVWTPDGNRVTFSSSRAGAFNLFWKLADGTGSSELLLTSEYDHYGTSWSPDGKMLAYEEQHPTTGFDIWLLPMEAGRLPTAADKPQPFLRTEFDERWAVFSPDGRWLAYGSDESGRYEVYVQPYPGPGGKWLISTAGGYHPLWAPDREDLELFYHDGNKMMVVPIETEPSFSPGTPKTLFELKNASVVPPFDISPDGQHFVMIQKGEQSAAPTQLRVVLNWFEELKAKVPTGK
jgi:serine/threonine-protein kinase